MESYRLSKQQMLIYDTRETMGDEASAVVYRTSFDGNLAEELLVRCVLRLVRKYRILRARVLLQDGEPVQVFDQRPEDLCFYRHFASEADADAFARELMQRPLDFRQKCSELYVYNADDDTRGIIANLSHIVCDGWTCMLLVDELEALLRGEDTGDGADLDYVTHMEGREQKLAPRVERDVDFWLDVYADADPALLYQRGGDSFTFSQVSMALAAHKRAEIEAFCQGARLSIAQFFNTATAVFIQKQCAEEGQDIFINTPIHNRLSRKDRSVYGMFVNTYPLAVSIDPDESFAANAKEGAKHTMGALRHQSCTYDEVMDAMRERLGHTIELADVTLNFLMQDLTIPYRDVVWYPTLVQPGSLSITVNEWGSDGALNISFDYNDTRFAKDDVERMMGRFAHLIDEIITRDEPVRALSLLTDEERDLVLHAFNQTERNFGRRTIVEWFEDVVARSGDADAVVCGDESLSYAELNGRANCVACRLRELGVRPDDYVAMFAHKSTQMIVGIMGILKAGGAYVPLDPDYPEDRKEYILSDCQPKAVLVYGATWESDVPVIDLADSALYERDANNPERVNQPRDLAYAIYTSGTTGLPKGVLIEHRNVGNLVGAYTDVWGLTSQDSVLQAANYVFDNSVWEIFNTLFVGARLVLAPKELMMDPDALGSYCQRNAVTAMSLTPAVICELDPTKFDTVRVLETGAGEANPGVLDRWRKPGRTIINTYGPTEYCVNATTYVCPDTLPTNVPVGKPMANTSLYVLKGNELCGIGMAGELCIAGDSLARGYLNNDRMNREHFVPNPFGDGRMYRTGDLVWWDAEGNIVFLGRIDEQVKIRGYRIELGEIDHALRSLDEVCDCAVVAREDKGGAKAIYAYVVGEGKLDLLAIRSSLRERLPEYMVPAYLAQIERIPQTRNGKVDRRVLPEISGTVRKAHVAPTNEAERVVCDIFQRILGVERVGVDDDFFDLGGHSLRATRLANLMESLLGARIPIAKVFQNPTPRALAALASVAKGADYVPIPLAQEKPYYPMSSAQKRTYLIYAIDENKISYNMPGCLTIIGDVDAERVRSCMQQMVDRHEILRTAFLMVDGEPVQEICHDVVADFSYIEDADATEHDLIDEFLAPFDLARPSQLRMQLVRRRDDWLLFLDMHHIISDGMSVNIFLEEFSTLYDGGELLPLSHQYKDYSEWMSTRDLSGQERFWVSQFGDEIPVLDMPLDYPRPQRQSYDGGKVTRPFGKKASQAVRDLAARYGATDYMVLLAAAMALLAKYSRQEDVVVGSPISGRTHRDTESMMGMFVNSLAMRGRPARDKRFGDFLLEVKKLCLDAYANQEYPFEELVEKVETTRDFSRNPIFDVMLVLQNNEEVNLRLGECTCTAAEYDEEIAKFDLTFTLSEHEGEFALDLGYCSALYKRRSAELIAEHFVRFVQNAAEGPELAISKIAAFSDDEANTVVKRFNSLHVDYDPADTVVRLFEDAVAAYPSKTAVVFGEQTLSYDELNRKANQLARHLRALGVGRGDFVAIYMSRCLEVVESIYGILKAGGAYLPIDPSYPADRIAYLLGDARPKAILAYRAELPEGMEVEVPLIDLEHDEVFVGDDGNLGLYGTVSDLAYSIYTSGTTGRPKGTLIPQTGIVRLVRQCDYAVLDEDTVIIQTGQLAFDASTFEIFGTTLNGGKLCLPVGDSLLDGAALTKMAHDEGVNVMFITTALFNYFTDNNIELFRHIRTVLTGGEKISVQHVEKFKAAYPDIDLKNVYGPTENTTFTTKYPIRAIDGNIPIGCPINNTQLYVLDGDELCGIGMPGELCMAGDGLALGYSNNPELTAAKFVDNPFGAGKMYRSGDLAAWNADGDIEFIGRVDEQVKIRGFRIEPAEIDSAIRNLGYVTNCAVVVREDKGGSLAVFAYLVGEGQIDTAQAREDLSKTLPEYMLPSYMMQIDEIPVTGNGKVDKRRLPEIEGTLTSEYVAPANESEAIVCDIFADILSLDRVGTQDSFFDIGGHSLRATKLVNQIEARTGAKIALKDVFSNPTPGRLAKLVDAGKGDEYVPIPHAPEQRSYPMSSTQKRTYLVVQMDEGGLSYNMPGGFALKGELDVDWLRHAMQRMVDRHEILRTRFLTLNGEPVQEVCEGVEASFVFLEDEKSDVEELFGAFVRPFDLARPSQLRMQVVRRAPDEHLLMVDMHHIISDGMSVNIFISELSSLYNGEELPELKAQYKDYSEWMRTRDLTSQRDYWLGQFGVPAPVLDMPYDFPRPQSFSYRGATIERPVPQGLRAGIDRLANRTGTTPYMVLLACLMVTLARYSRQDDIVVGSPISARTHKDTESMMGMFVNTLAMRGVPEPDKTFDDFLHEVSQTCLAAYENQEYPFEELVDAVVKRRDFSRNPLFDVMLVLQNNEDVPLRLNGATGSWMEFDTKIAKFDLTFNITDTEGHYAVLLEYCTDLFTPEAASGMVDHFLRIVEDAIEDGSQAIGAMDIVTQADRDIIFGAFNQNDADYPRQKTVVDLFEEQVERTPHNVALQYEGQTLTYREVNERANQLAHRLRAMGVRADDFVAMYVARSFEMVIGMLGVIKAGGAYVPMDPAYPVDRVEYMLDDCEPKAILTYQAQLETTIPVVDLGADDVWCGPATNPEHVNTPSDRIYCIYTSGTTGRPKGVMLEHGNITRLFVNDKCLYDFDEHDVWMIFHYYGFDFSVWEMYGALLFGGKLLIPTKECARDSAMLMRFIRENHLTVLNQVPSAFYNLQTEDFDGNDLDVRYLIFGGEALNPQRLYDWHRRHPACHIVNMYGITETTVHVTYRTIGDQEIARGISDIGKPIPTLCVYVMNGDALCGVGIPGELCVTGAGVARGYLHRPELNDAKFVDNPFGEGRMYRSGDLARMLPDGNLEYLGRIDEQVKIRGFRIELSEIANVIQAIPQVKDCAVIARADKAGDKSISAYIVENENISFSRIRDIISEKIPEYMLPSHMMTLDALPITINGKLDRRALPEIENKSEIQYVAPRSDQERVVCEALFEVLSVARVGVLDSFFELGGDSINAIRAVAAIRKRGYEVSVKDVLAAAVVERIAQRLEATQATAYAQDEVNGPVPLTPIVKAFGSWQLAKPEHYNQSVIFEVDHDEEVAKRAIDALLKQHDILRSTYVDGALLTLPYREFRNFDFAAFDYSGRPDVVSLVDATSTELQASIDLSEGPLVKVGYFKTDDGRYLMMAIHHLLVDVVSWHIIVEDFQTAAGQLEEGHPVALPRKTASYRDWANALETYGSSKKLAAEIPYWEQMAKRSFDATLAIPKQDREFTKYGTVSLELNEMYAEMVLYDAMNFGRITPLEVLLAALTLTCEQTTGQRSILVNMEAHGREELDAPIDITRTVGWFTAFYPLVLDYSGTLGDLLFMVHDAVRSVPNKGMGYGLLKDRIPTAKPDVTLNYMGVVDHDVRFTSGEDFSASNAMSEDISINVSVVGDRLVTNIYYNDSAYDEQTMVSFGNDFNESVKHVAGEIVRQSMLVEETTGGELLLNIYNLAPLQKGMLFFYLNNPQTTEYVVQFGLRLNFGVNVEALERATEYLSLRFDALRTAIAYEGMVEPRQVVFERRKPGFGYQDFLPVRASAREERVRAFEEADVRRGFDLLRDPLIRFGLIRLDTDSFKLVVTLHHIIEDGWSNSLILGGLFKYYTMVIEGKTDREIKRVIALERARGGEYADYIEWIEGHDEGEFKDFWATYLDGYETPADVRPFDEPLTTQHQAGHAKVDLSETLSNKIRELVSANSITVSTVLETALGIMLQIYNNTDDVVFGKVVSGRQAPLDGIDDIVGLFSNTIPIRVNATQGMTALELMRKQQDDDNDCAEYGYGSLSTIQGVTTLGNELIKVLYAFENYYVSEEAEGIGRTLDFTIEDSREQTNYGISFGGYETGDTIALEVLYDASVFTPAASDLLLAHYRQVVEQIVGDPDIAVAQVCCFDDDERETVLHGLNDTYHEIPDDVCYQALFEEVVQEYADKTAVVADEGSVTFAELNAKANALGRKLRGYGVGANDIVPFVTDRSLNMVLGVHAIVKAGAAYVIIDPSYPQDRIDYILGVTQPKVILVNDAPAQKAGSADVPIVDLGLPDAFEGNTTNLPHVNGPDDLIYCIFTSGTTGVPKGVANVHRGTINHSLFMRDVYGYDDTARIFAKTRTSFDVSAWEMLNFGLTGSTLFVLAKGGEQDPDIMLQQMVRHQITHVDIVPSILQMILLRLQENEWYRVGLSHLRVVFSGGEAVAQGHVDAFDRLLGHNGARLVDVYGPAEATIDVTSCVLDRTYATGVPIGVPEWNTQIFILNGNRLCGIGIPGELCIGGYNLARGYVGLPEKTEEVFVPNPVGEGTIYRSGDLAMWNLDGSIAFLGRIDEQVKIRGLRVELGEIDAVLRSLDVVKNCAVIARDDDSGSKAIFAYLVSDERVDFAKVRAYLATKVPDYMVPAYMTQIDEIPVTRNGKVDKRALPQIASGNEQDYVEPVTDVERLLCQSFQSVLGAERVGVTDRFYDVGGDSIKAISLVSLLKQAVMEGRLPSEPPILIGDIIRLQTPQALAGKLEGNVGLHPVPIPFDPMSGEGDYLLHRPQQSLADGEAVAAGFVQQLFLDETPEAVIIEKVAVPKRIGLDALVDALGRVVRGTVFEYAYDADAREFVRYPHARDTINVYGLKEEMGDLLIRSYSREHYRLDGRTLLSELFVWNPKEGENNYVYLCVSHAIWDGMSSGAFVTNLSMALSGDQTPVAAATSDVVVQADAQATSGEEFMAAVGAFDDLLCVTRQSYSIEERPMDYAQYLSPIETVMETYVRANPLLKRLREVPLVVLDSGRDATNGRLLGNFLVPRLACYNVESGSVRYVLPTDLPDVGSVLRSKLLRVPLVNYLGVVDTTKATDDYLTLRRQGVLEHAGAGTSITANVEDGTLVVEYPVYAEEV